MSVIKEKIPNNILHFRSHLITMIQDGDVAQQLMFHSIIDHESSNICIRLYSRFFLFLQTQNNYKIMAYAYLFKYIIIGDTGLLIN